MNSERFNESLSGNIGDYLEQVAQELPIIRPITEFIHLNLLLPYQHLPFWTAIKEVSEKLEAMPFAELSFYQEKIRTKELTLDLIESKMIKNDLMMIEEKMQFIKEGNYEFPHHDLRVGHLHNLWNQSLDVNIIQLADSMLIKWIGIYMDQGITLWEMPGVSEKGFYASIRALMKDSFIKTAPFSGQNLDSLFPENPEDSIKSNLDYLCPEKSYQMQYLRESIFSLRGWAGLIYCVEKNPQLLAFKRKPSLVDFMAVKLILEKAWITNTNEGARAPDFKQSPPKQTDQKFLEIFKIFKSLQEALEEESYKKILNNISFSEQVDRPLPEYQAIFCMDDRECSLRRYIEGLSPVVETFGTAGHFGIECLYQGINDSFPKKHCPAPISAKYLLKEDGKESIHKNHIIDHPLIQPSHEGIEDLKSSFLGSFRALRILLTNLFFPLIGKDLKNVLEINTSSDINIQNKGESQESGLKVGYSLEEMGELLYSQLKLIGFIHHYAPLVFIIGHGSNSVNNPYFATYGCGACSGRSGSVNARIFVKMANDLEVRKYISNKYGLSIPNETHFIAGFHDTCRDVIEFYDTSDIPEFLEEKFKKFKKIVSVALYKNAKERSQSFKLVSYRPISLEAQKEVLRRSFSLFETRPELGHTNVAFAIVGRRKLTGGLNLNRRSFLQSYDRSIDAAGDILAASLGAVIPVTSGISLDYYFSRVDNLRFGAGSKLPQNIVGNFGVSHGTESDLLFGLPNQMIDQHTPLRLFVLVEHKPEIAMYAFEKNPLVKQIVYNNWVHYGCWDEDTNSFYIFNNGQMIRTGKKLENLC